MGSLQKHLSLTVQLTRILYWAFTILPSSLLLVDAYENQPTKEIFVPSLGRTNVSLGSVYNSNSFQFLDNPNLFPDGVPRYIHDYYSYYSGHPMKYRQSTVQKTADKFKLVNVEPNLGQAILKSQVSVTGSWRYLLEPIELSISDLDNTILGGRKEIQSGIEGFSNYWQSEVIKKLGNSNWEEAGAIHMVTSIVWGGAIIVEVNLLRNGSFTTEQLEKEMENLDEGLLGQDCTASSCLFRLYSDVSENGEPGQNLVFPTTLGDLKETVKELSKVTGKFPTRHGFWLMSLDQLLGGVDQTEVDSNVGVFSYTKN